MAIWIAIGVVLVGLLFYFVLGDYVRYMLARVRGQLPPGPAALPIIGSPGMNENAPWETTTQWAQRYGDLFTFFLGPQLQLVIAEAELARQVLKDARFEGRPSTNLSRVFTGHALAFTEGSRWRDTRKFEITALKDFGRGGSGSNLLEEYVQQASQELVKEIYTEASSSPTGRLPNGFYSKDAMQRYVANSIASVLCGQSLKSDDPRFDRITSNVAVILGSSTTPSSPLNVFPWLRHVPPFSSRQALLEERMAETTGFIGQVVDEHKRNFDPDNVRDFIDAYLKEQAKDSSDKNSFTDTQLIYMGVEMYAAGLDGTLAALQWWLLLISSHMDIQRRCQEEIDGELGNERLVSWSDRSSLPYCEAAMNEVLRIAVVDPFGLPHRCTEDVPLRGFTIPKDTSVIMNYYGMHFCPENFPEPWQFRPERFLDANGKYQANTNSLPFATGRRMCSGDNFAKTILFIGMVSLLQRFSFERPAADKRDWKSIPRINAVGVHPDKFFVIAKSR